MLRWQKKLLLDAYIFIDFMAIIISVLICILMTCLIGNRMFWQQSTLEIIGFIGAVSFVNILLFIITELYEPFMTNEKVVYSQLIFKDALIFSIGYLFTYIMLDMMFPAYSHMIHLFFFVSFFILSMVLKGFFHEVRIYRKNQSEITRNVLLIGQSLNGILYEEIIKGYEYLNYNIVGFLHINNLHEMTDLSTHESIKDIRYDYSKDQGGELFADINDPNEKTTNYFKYKTAKHLGGLDDLETILKTFVIDELVVTRPLSYCDSLIEKLKYCQERGITITMLLNRQYYDSTQLTVSMIGDLPAVKFHTVSLDESQRMAKRLLDIAGASVGMILFAISWLVFAPLIKLESKGPVIFKQLRVGKNGRTFEIWKFRTMFEDAEIKKKELDAFNEVDGQMFKMTCDPRVTRIGSFLRKTSIDEMPQFYNVLVGDMSLVGTRPPTLDEVNKYKTHHYRRISIIPGMSGIWQISGRSEVHSFEEIVKLDTQYIENWSIWKDVEILVKTIKVVILRKGAH